MNTNVILTKYRLFENPIEVQKFTWIYRHDCHEIILEISFWIETHNAIAPLLDYK